MELLCLENVRKSYGTTTLTKALDGFCCRVEKGEFVSIMGKSGSGKSTVLNVLAGIDGIDSGKYVFEGKEVGTLKGDAMTVFRRDHIGFVLQHFALIPDMTIYENIILPLRMQKMKQNEIDQRATRVSKDLEITDLLSKFPSEVSGGQAQRAAIARAIIHEPELILADEPTGALDEETGYKILDIFTDLNKKGHTILMVTHDKSVAEKSARIIYVKDGKNVA